jgi:hypothetical protein
MNAFVTNQRRPIPFDCCGRDASRPIFVLSFYEVR